MYIPGINVLGLIPISTARPLTSPKQRDTAGYSTVAVKQWQVEQNPCGYREDRERRRKMFLYQNSFKF